MPDQTHLELLKVIADGLADIATVQRENQDYLIQIGATLSDIRAALSDGEYSDGERTELGKIVDKIGALAPR